MAFGCCWGFAQTTYLVRPGDTLSAIARAQGISVEILKTLNGLTNTLIFPGQSLKLPGAEGVGLLEHTVAAGETLSSIASRYGLSEDLLKGANPDLATVLGDSPMIPGLLLLIPPSDGIVVRLGEGDTLLSVALRYGLAPAELARLNGLSASSHPRAVFIPEGMGAVAALTPAPEAVASSALSARERHLERQRGLLALAAEQLARYEPPSQVFVWPLQGPLSSGYGRRNISVGGNTFHGGIDIVGAAGAPVRAARAGVVSRASWGGAYGYVLYLEHEGGAQTRYAHLNRFLVGVGALVAQGETIGEVGSTGASTGSHLHFEIRFAGRSVDPLGYLPR